MTKKQPGIPVDAHETRDRVLKAALALIDDHGLDGLTTRAVADRAGVQVPTIYRLFGDKQQLLDAVAEHGFNIYVAQKPKPDTNSDPVDGLRQGWDLHVNFGLANPGLFVAMYGGSQAGRLSPAALRAISMLKERMRALAAAGRLRMSERKAADMLRSAACGVVFVLLETPTAERDSDLSNTTRDTMIARITLDELPDASPSLASAATTLNALLSTTKDLTDGESRLLSEWLERLSRPDRS